MKIVARFRMNFRKFVRIFLLFLAIFIVANYVVWHFWTEELFSKKFDGGDLARKGYLPGVKLFRKTESTLPRRHLQMHDFRGQPIDVLTIGDSFSFGSGRGPNPYYQDFIATNSNVTVMNVYPYPTGDLFVGFSPLSTLAVLYKSGYLDMLKPKYILIESVERYCLVRFAKPLNFTANEPLNNVVAYFQKVDEANMFQPPEINFVNDGNLKFLWANLAYRISDNYKDQVYVFDLNRPLFSVKKDRTLVTLGEDIRNVRFANKDTVAQLNAAFNKLADILAGKGILLYFMPVVDKYDLYSEFIIDNPYPKSCFFEELRKLPKKYKFIDTKAILLEEIRRGEKDIFIPMIPTGAGKLQRRFSGRFGLNEFL